MSRVACHVLPITRYTSHVTSCHVLHFTYYISLVTFHVLHVTRYISRVNVTCLIQCFTTCHMIHWHASHATRYTCHARYISRVTYVKCNKFQCVLCVLSRVTSCVLHVTCYLLLMSRMSNVTCVSNVTVYVKCHMLHSRIVPVMRYTCHVLKLSRVDT